MEPNTFYRAAGVNVPLGDDTRVIFKLEDGVEIHAYIYGNGLRVMNTTPSGFKGGKTHIAVLPFATNVATVIPIDPA